MRSLLVAATLLLIACNEPAPPAAPPMPPVPPVPPIAQPTPLPIGTPTPVVPTPTNPPIPDVAPVPPAPPGAPRNPDWPCAKNIETYLLGTNTERYDFEFGGPAACQTPPDIDLIGCPTRETRTINGNTRVRTFRYDPAGRLTSIEYSSGTRLAVNWSPEGTLTGMDVDGNGDGTRDDIVTYRTERSAMIWERDAGGDGTPDFRSRYRLDRSGRILGHELDRGADGTPDLRTTHTYQGHRRVSSQDVGVAAGNVITNVTYVYDCP